MVNHCGQLTSRVNCKFTQFPQWLLYFSSFKFLTFTPSSLFPDDLVSYSTKKVEAIRREHSTCPWLILHIYPGLQIFFLLSQRMKLPTNWRPIPNTCSMPPSFNVIKDFTFLVDFSPLCLYLHYAPFLLSHSH